MVNCITSQPLSRRLCTVLCDEMGGTHKACVLHPEVPWASRGKALRHLFGHRLDKLRVCGTPFLPHRMADKLWFFALVFGRQFPENG